MTSLLAKLPLPKGEHRVMPPADPTDDVIPVHLFDDMAAARGIVLVWVYQFHDILDPEKLHIALSELFQMDGWRKFSGRFRYRPDGGLEIHVPKVATKERPAVYFTKENHDGPMADHPIASRFPEPTSRIAMSPGPKEFCSLGIGPGTPRSMDDFVYSGLPAFCLHVHTFTDGTLVCFTHSHVTCDLMGLEAILRGWSLVLAGKADQVPLMVGYREDPLQRLWDPSPIRPHIFANKVLDGWRFKYWALRNLYESWRSPDVQSRTLCIPRRDMNKIMRTARQHIQAEVDRPSGESKPFISEGDVLAALAIRVLAQYQGPGSTRLIATLMALNPRNRVKSVFREDTAYIFNSPTNVHVFCSADQAVGMPLGQLALLVRKSINAQTQEDQVRAAVALSVNSMATNKMPVVFGDKNMAAQFMSNWSGGKYAEKMDFSPAVIKEAQTRPSYSKLGHPVYYQAVDPSHNTVSVISSVFVVLRKDFDGNTWFSISMPEKMWSDLMDYLHELTEDYRASL